MDQADLIGIWSTGFWQNDLSAPTQLAASTISGYATQPSTLGRLNNLVSTCFSGSGYTGAGTTNYQASPPLTNTELVIIGTMFLVSYYNGLAFSTMGVGGSTIPWLNIAEGDSKIGRVNAASIGAQYKEMSKDAQNQLWQQANAYRSSNGGNLGRDVEYLSIANPTWGPSFYGP